MTAQEAYAKFNDTRNPIPWDLGSEISRVKILDVLRVLAWLEQQS